MRDRQPRSCQRTAAMEKLGCLLWAGYRYRLKYKRSFGPTSAPTTADPHIVVVGVSEPQRPQWPRKVVRTRIRTRCLLARYRIPLATPIAARDEIHRN